MERQAAVTRFGILGTVEVEGESGPLVVRGTRRRALLVRLLASANQPIAADRIAEDLWDGEPPQGASSTLTSHLSLLRQLLGADRITNRAGSYTLRVEPGELDADEFVADVAEGHAALGRGDPQAAVESLERGLGRWRGPALADVASAGWAQGSIARFDELRLTAEEALLEAEMALGRHREVVAAAQSAVEAEPLREQRWATLMLALYRSGRQADALRAFQRLRHRLDEELGIVPSTTLGSLEESILLHRPELDWKPSATVSAPGPPSAVVATSGQVVVLVALLSGAGLSSDPDPGHDGPVIDDLPRRDPGRAGPPWWCGAVRPVCRADRLLRQSLGRLGRGHGNAAGHRAAPGAACPSRPPDWTGLRRDHPGPGGVPRPGARGGRCAGPDGPTGRDPRDRTRAAAERSTEPARLLDQTAGGGTGRTSHFQLRYSSGSRWSRSRSTYPCLSALHYPNAEYVGRSVELALLSSAFDRAVAGQRQVVVVGGEPGIGKTALTAVMAQAVDAAGAVVLYGRCHDLGAPYQPFVDALSYYVQFAPRRELEGHVAAHGGELSRLVPALTHRVPGTPPPSTSDPDTERYLAFTAAIGLVAEACRHRPVVLVLDDLHWADLATLALLRQLVSASAGLPLLVVGTFRSNEVDAAHPLSDALAALWREPGVSRLELTGLTFDDLLDLCVAMAGHPVDDVDFVTDLQRDTGGNPFFVRELLRHLVEAGALLQDDDTERWFADRSQLRSGLPSSLREVIAERVRHLGPEAPTVLALAAVIGLQFELSVLALACDTEEGELLDLLEQAERSALLEEVGDGGTFLFAHALTRHTLYDGLGPTRRRRLHAKVATALEQGVSGPPAAARLAFHFTEADQLAPALHYAELAGHEALQAMAPSEAAGWFEEAAALLNTVQPEDVLRRCDLTIQLGLARLLAGDPAHRLTLLEAGTMAEEAGDARRMAVAALCNSRGYYSAAGQIDHERLGALRRALECLGSSDAGLRARLLGALCSESVFGSPLVERVHDAQLAVAEARALDDPFVLLSVLNMVFESLRHPSVLTQRLLLTEEAMVLAAQVENDPAASFWVVANRMQTLIEAGAVAEAERLFGRLVTIAEEVGHPAMQWMAVYAGAQWSLLRGETATGEAQAEEALALGLALGQPDAFNYFATQISHARWQQGRLDELVELIEAGAPRQPRNPRLQRSIGPGTTAGRAS